MSFGRRTILAAGAAGFAAPALIGRAGAQTIATPAGVPDAAAAKSEAQAPGFYRFKVGDFVVTTVNDGFLTAPVDGLFAPAQLPRAQSLLRDAFLSPTVFHNPFTLTFVEMPQRLVMFDTGTGGQMGPQTGKLAANLRAAGLDLSRVTTVVFSHFHVDHINGLLAADGTPTVPNAEIFVPETEWAFWTDRSNEGRSPDFQKRNFANVEKRFAPYRQRVQPYTPGKEVLPGITSMAAPGHTPGHTIFRIADGSDQAMFLADTAHRPELFVRAPDLHAIIDFDPDLAERTRRRVLDMVATDRIRVTGYHYPFPSNGFMAKDGDGFRFVPANWTSVV